MKILYISIPPFFDLDLSLVNHLSKHCDVYYLLDIAPFFLKSTALDIKNQEEMPGIFCANIYKELIQFKKFIPVEKFYIINRLSKKSYSSSNLRLQKQLVNFIDELNPDIIHLSHFVEINYLYFLLRNKRKLVLTVHDPFPHSGETSIRKKAIRSLNYLFFKNILLLNKSQINQYKKVTRIYRFNSIFVSSLGIYEYLKDYKIDPIKDSKCKFSILFIGRISPYKGVDILLKAFSEIEINYSNIELVIAGSGNYWFDISSYKKNQKIKFINRYIQNEELVDLINSAKIIVCPYKDATQSGVIMTAFALNKPVIATKVGGLQEMIEDNLTGFLIPSNDVKSLQSKLIDLIESPEILENISRNIENEFANGPKSWSKIIEDLCFYYSTLK